MPKIFISYRRDDSEHITGRIHDRLEPHFGRDNVFFDLDNIPFGVDFREYLDAAVGQCDILLAVIGDEWIDVRYGDGPKAGERRLDDVVDFVRIEIESALARGIPVIPVLVGRARMPGEQELPEGLKRLAYRNAAEVRSGRDFRDHIDRLIRGIEYLLKQGVGKSGAAAGRSPQELVIGPVPMAGSEKEPVPPGEIVNSIGMRLMLVPAGKFLMGSPDGEGGEEERPRHEVEITRPFYMGAFQVTQEQYQRVMGNNPSYFCAAGGGKEKVSGLDTKRFPVEQVNWDEAVAFCERLSNLPEEKKAGRTCRLPTEAEWEYSCRGGLTSQTPFHFGDSLNSTQANFDGNYPYGNGAKGPYLERPCPVGTYPANAFGLFDMHGNVWEWCLDWYDVNYYKNSPKRDPQGAEKGESRVLRGGSWLYYGNYCRSAYRYRYAPGNRNHDLGFRVCVLLDL